MTNPIFNCPSSPSSCSSSSSNASSSSSSSSSSNNSMGSFLHRAPAPPPSFILQAITAMNDARTAPTTEPEPVAPPQKSEIPPEILKGLVKRTTENLLLEARTFFGDQAQLPSLAALSILSVKEVCTLVLMRINLVFLEKYEANKLIQEHIPIENTLMALELALNRGDVESVNLFFSLSNYLNFSEEVRMSLESIQKKVLYLKSKHAEDLSKNLGEFFPEGKLIPTPAEVGTLAREVLLLQDELLARLHPLFCGMENNLHRRLDGLVNSFPSISGIPSNLQKEQKEFAAQSLRLYKDLLRIVRQFSIYASLRREKVKNAVYHTREHLSDEFLVSSLNEQNKLYTALTTTKNPYTSDSIAFLDSLYDALCISSGLFCEQARIADKIKHLLQERASKSAEYLMILAIELHEDPLTMQELCDIGEEVSNELCRSYGENIKSSKGKMRDHPKRAIIKHAIETLINDNATLTYQIMSGGFESLETLFRMNKTTPIDCAKGIPKLHQAVMDINRNFGEKNPQKSPSDKSLIMGSVSLLMHMLKDDRFNDLKTQTLKSNRESQSKIYGSAARADVANSTAIEEIKEISDIIYQYKKCDNLLLQMSPLIAACHAFLSQHTHASPNLEEYEWFHELEERRVLKRKEVKSESSTSTTQKGNSSTATSATRFADTAHVAIEKTIQKLPIQAPLKVQSTDTPLLKMFVKAKEIMLGQKSPDMKEMDSDLLYHADAAYHLFHAVTILDMIKTDSAEQLRFYIPELVNALALVQEQIITPIYVREKNPKTVIHDLNKMSNALKITKNYSFNFGSQCFRYPHAIAEMHAKYKRESPKWLQEMLTLDDQIETSFEDNLKHSLDRVQIGLEFATELLGSDSLKLVAAEVKERIKKVHHSEKTFETTPHKEVGNLMSLIEKADKKVEEKNNPKLTILWKDLKVHARRFKRAEELFRAHPEQKLLSVYARAIIMSAQYFVEHTGHILTLLNTGDDINSHSLSDFAVLCNWESKIDEKWMKFLDYLDIKKGADYPHWSIYNGKDAKALDIINGAFEVATIAAESDEGFQGTSKESRKPEEVRRDLRKFADDSLGLMKALAQHLHDSL